MLCKLRVLCVSVFKKDKKTNMKITLNLILKIAIAIILLQTLYFKFTASTESVYIFTTLGIEPYGRIGIGILELLAVLLLFPKRTALYGALLSGGLMAGAIFSHLSTLGIVVMNDGGELFILAVVVGGLSALLALRLLRL